jgi:hypothetical protein
LPFLAELRLLQHGADFCTERFNGVGNLSELNGLRRFGLQLDQLDLDSLLFTCQFTPFAF